MRSSELSTIIKANKTFIIIYTFLLLVGAYPLLALDKVKLFLIINKHHHYFLDQFFFYLTHLGSGITYIILVFILFLFKIPLRKLLIGIVSFGVMSIIVQVLKRAAFPHHLRPIKILSLANEAAQLHIVDKVDVLTHLSFPSGHAATIFTATCFLSLISRRKHIWNSIGLLFVATLVAYSRAYLCQHFYTDIYIGALIGGWTALIVYIVLIDLPILSRLLARLSCQL